ncbi:Uncharacterised protein [Mycobacteroides abscessus subsp. abscessus]|nr:Uncharacterised protein [Mycobacteroides abscessus subsp. abscessus]SKW53288.1 Uncharacterised protein [Mycobacteroides abscessus subsp. abscessus]
MYGGTIHIPWPVGIDEPGAAQGGPVPREKDVFDRNRYAVKQTAGVVAAPALLGFRGRRQCRFLVDETICIDRTVVLGDSG